APAAGTGLRDRHIDQISALHDGNAPTGPLAAPPPAPHEPGVPTHELENQLAAIDHTQAGTPEQLVAVRGARGEIATLEAMRDNVVNGGEPWEHATPEQRGQQIKLLDDQIRSTAEDALDQHRQSQPELAPSAPRTPDEIAARQREVAAARE